MSTENKEPKKDGRGGRRAGSGRKPTARTKMYATFYMRIDLVERLRQEQEQGKLLDTLLEKYFAGKELNDNKDGK